MHEVSLVKNIFQLLEESFPERMHDIAVIKLQAGLLSNVQPVLMQNAFDAVLMENPGFAGMQLEVEILPIIIHCDVCNKETAINNYTFVCECGEPCKNIIQGEELRISQVMFKETVTV